MSDVKRPEYGSETVREAADRAAESVQKLKSRRGTGEAIRAFIRQLTRRNKLAVICAVLILLCILAAVLAPVLTPYSCDEKDLECILSSPSAAHLLGTDESGRDILTRLLYGARTTLLAGILPAILSVVIGAGLGIISGIYGGKADNVISRLTDIVSAFPAILLAMIVMYMLESGTVNVFVTLVLVNWANTAGIVRAETLRIRKTEYVEAARVVGVGKPVLIRRHILPNCMHLIIVLFMLNVPAAILMESSLSFLGLGIQPPGISWGMMVNIGRKCLGEAPWVGLVPGVAVMVIVLAFHILGKGLQDLFDADRKR